MVCGKFVVLTDIYKVIHNENDLHSIVKEWARIICAILYINRRKYFSFIQSWFTLWLGTSENIINYQSEKKNAFEMQKLYYRTFSDCNRGLFHTLIRQFIHPIAIYARIMQYFHFNYIWLRFQNQLQLIVCICVFSCSFWHLPSKEKSRTQLQSHVMMDSLLL